MLTKEFVAALRTRTPSLFYIPGLVIGQIGAATLQALTFPGRSVVGLFDVWGVSAFVLLALYILWSYQKPSNSFLFISALSGTLGFASMQLVIPNHVGQIPDDAGSYYVEVDKEPRHRIQGELELSLNVLARLREPERKGEISSIDVKDGAKGMRLLCKAVLLPWKNVSTAQIGSRFIMKASYRITKFQINPFTYDNTLIRRGYNGTCKIRYVTSPSPAVKSAFSRLRETFRTNVQRVLGDKEATGLFLAMVVGTKDVLSRSTEEAFKRSGLAHLLVVSGYQVTLVYYLFAWLIKKIILKSRYLSNNLPCVLIGTGGGLLFAALYTCLVGVDGPSLRACLAVGIVVVARSFEREHGMLNSICVSFLTLALIWPGVYLEPGVQLTYGALLGICLGISGRKHWLLRFFQSAIFASLFTSVISIFWFHQFSVLGLLLNPLVAPFVASLSCKGGLLALGAYYSGIDATGLLLQLMQIAIATFRDVVIILSSISWCAYEVSGYSAYLLAPIILLPIIVCFKARLTEWTFEEHLPVTARFIERHPRISQAKTYNV